MSLFKIFDVAGSAISAQSLRLNTTASNLANADAVASNPQGAYRSRHPVFQTLMYEMGKDSPAGVRTLGVVESQAEIQMRHAPDHPLADENGNVYASNVNSVEELVNMISASRSYQTNVEVLNTSKQLLLRTLTLGE